MKKLTLSILIVIIEFLSCKKEKDDLFGYDQVIDAIKK